LVSIIFFAIKLIFSIPALSINDKLINGKRRHLSYFQFNELKLLNFLAVINNDLLTLSECLKQGAEINYVDEYQITLIMRGNIGI
jgi:hypothetical protein